LNSPMYKELSSDDENFESFSFAPDATTTQVSKSPAFATNNLNSSTNNNGNDKHNNDEFTPTSSAGSTSRKSVPKKRKKDSTEKVSKPKKPRAPKVPSDSPSKTLVNRFKQNQGEMVRTISENPVLAGGASSMARVSPAYPLLCVCVW